MLDKKLIEKHTDKKTSKFSYLAKGYNVAQQEKLLQALVAEYKTEVLSHSEYGEFRSAHRKYQEALEAQRAYLKSIQFKTRPLFRSLNEELYKRNTAHIKKYLKVDEENITSENQIYFILFNHNLSHYQRNKELKLKLRECLKKTNGRGEDILDTEEAKKLFLRLYADDLLNKKRYKILLAYYELSQELKPKTDNSVAFENLKKSITDFTGTSDELRKDLEKIEQIHQCARKNLWKIKVAVSLPLTFYTFEPMLMPAEYISERIPGEDFATDVSLFFGFLAIDIIVTGFILYHALSVFNKQFMQYAVEHERKSQFPQSDTVQHPSLKRAKFAHGIIAGVEVFACLLLAGQISELFFDKALEDMSFAETAPIGFVAILMGCCFVWAAYANDIFPFKNYFDNIATEEKLETELCDPVDFTGLDVDLDKKQVAKQAA